MTTDEEALWSMFLFGFVMGLEAALFIGAIYQRWKGK